MARQRKIYNDVEQAEIKKRLSMARERKIKVIVQYDAADAEIKQIKEKMQYIELAARKTLPTAIEIGEWFAKQRAKLGKAGWDDWEGWLQSKFPDKPLRMIHRYVQLASEKQFLLAKFAVPNTAEEIDYEALPTLKEALAAIQEKNRPIKRGAGRAPAKARTIDVKATVSAGANGSSNAERPIRILPPTETLSKLQEDKETVEDPDAPRTPMEEIGAELNKSASCLRAAAEFWQKALVIAQHHEIPIETVRAELTEHMDDQPELALCLTAKAL